MAFPSPGIRGALIQMAMYSLRAGTWEMMPMRLFSSIKNIKNFFKKMLGLLLFFLVFLIFLILFFTVFIFFVVLFLFGISWRGVGVGEGNGAFNNFVQLAMIQPNPSTFWAVVDFDPLAFCNSKWFKTFWAVHNLSLIYSVEYSFIFRFDIRL